MIKRSLGVAVWRRCHTHRSVRRDNLGQKARQINFRRKMLQLAERARKKHRAHFLPNLHARTRGQQHSLCSALGQNKIAGQV